MGLTTALYTGLTGLDVNSRSITVAGNNIANVNTTGFKSGRILFETLVSQNLKPASGPTANLGGSNSIQSGLGVGVGSVARNFTNGSITPTGVNTDIAIDGKGFFVLNMNGSTRYTRAGTFGLDRDFNLVNTGGGILQGFGVDSDFNVINGVLTNMRLPIGSMTLAEATRNVSFQGNLNAGGDVATQGSIQELGTFTDGGGPFADTTTLLTNLDSGGGPLFVAGDVITIRGAEKGGVPLAAHTFEVGATNTTGSDANGTDVQSFLDFLNQIFGIDMSADPMAGAQIDNTTGVISIVGNLGESNGLGIDSSDIILNETTTATVPFTVNQTQEADGESVQTTFVVFDSLGTPLTVDLTLVLEDATNNGGTTWRFYAQSEDDTDLSRVLGTGTLDFDQNGQLIVVNNGSFIVDRTDTGAQTPQQINLDFTAGGTSGGVSALTQSTSQIAAFSQDGSPIGTLEDFAIGGDGTVTGVFSNGLLRTLGKVVLATFSNPQGLSEIGNSLYVPTVNSGVGVLNSPGSGGAGGLVGGALELSNVDLSQEFINLINASTGFTANSRVLTTSERLIQELLQITR